MNASADSTNQESPQDQITEAKANNAELKQVLLETNYGEILIELDYTKTPATVENFLNYVNSGYYDQTIFHRVIPGFMIQGGGHTADMKAKNEGMKANIKNEADKGGPNAIGTIAMARTSDPHSASSQFFINVANNDFLNFRAPTLDGWGYCVFGKVIKGLDIVEKISKVKTTRKSGHEDVPVENVIILKAKAIDSTN